MSVFLWIFLLVFMVACGRSSPSAGIPAPVAGPGIGASSLFLTSGDLVTAEDFEALMAESMLASTASDCQAGAVAGKCLTPQNVTGYVSALSLGSDLSGDGPARLFGSNVGSISLAFGEDTSEDNPEGSYSVDFFDYLNFEENALEASDNLSDVEDKTATWILVRLDVALLDITVPIGDDTWAFRLAFVPAEPDQSEALQACLNEEELSAIAANNQFAGLGFAAGDLMFKKGDGDFQWWDEANHVASATRPGDNTLQHPWADQIEIFCTGEDEEKEIELGGYDYLAAISAEGQFQLSASLAAGSCVDYVYTPGLGDAQTGNSFSATFDFSSEESLFFNTTEDPENLSDAEIIESFQLRQIFTRSTQEFPAAPPAELQESVTATFELEAVAETACE